MFRYSPVQKSVILPAFSQETTGICTPSTREGTTRVSNEHNQGKREPRDQRSKGSPRTTEGGCERTAVHQASRTEQPTQNIQEGFSFQENKTGMYPKVFTHIEIRYTQLRGSGIGSVINILKKCKQKELLTLKKMK